MGGYRHLYLFVKDRKGEIFMDEDQYPGTYRKKLSPIRKESIYFECGFEIDQNKHKKLD